MTVESFLSSAVEAAIGMAGFASIVVAIRHRDISTWGQPDRILLHMLLLASGMAVAFALLPAILREARLPDPLIWRIGSGGFVVWQSSIAIRRARQFRAVGSRSPLPRFVYAWVPALVVLQLFNLVLAEAWPYLVAVFGVLVNAFAFFWVLLLGKEPHRGSRAGGDE